MAKPKPVNVELISVYESDGVTLTEPYRILDAIRNKHHLHLSEANIALMWRKRWREDKDNRLVLGKARLRSDAAKEFAEYDLEILLNMEAWHEMDNHKRCALMHHELTHFEVSKDKDGEIKRDEKDRVVYRIRGHDLEEFRSTVEEFGIYKSDIEAFVESALKAKEGKEDAA